MVSFWPWRHDDASPASFEKTLSSLSAKIATTQTQLEKARTGARRAKVLGTLYLGFAYVVYAVLLLLVVGWKKMGAAEWTGLAGAPALIYLMRTAITTFYGLRIDALVTRLKDQQDERARTIQKLKDATRYDSTLQLLEKYGGGNAKGGGGGIKMKIGDGEGGVDGPAGEDRDNNNNNNGSNNIGGGQEGQGEGSTSSPRHQLVHKASRTTLPPPPTANIQRPGSRAGTPQRGQQHYQQQQQQQQQPQQQQQQLQQQQNPNADLMDIDSTAEFAPNAFGPGIPAAPYPPQSNVAVVYAPPESHWYDRIIDTLLGEDETAARNRIALVCGRCRLVNGQAPPGTRSLAEIGVWRCMACGATNGSDAEDEGERIVRDVLKRKEESRDSDSVRPVSGSGRREGEAGGENEKEGRED